MPYQPQDDRPLPGEQPLGIEAPDDTRVHGWVRPGSNAAFPGTGVFVHGFRSGATGEKSLALARHAASRGYGWVRFDLRGHGRDAEAFERFSICGGLADTLAVLDRLGQQPTLLVGSSLGGWLAVLAAMRRSHQVRALLLIAPAFNFLRDLFGNLPDSEVRSWRDSGWRDLPDRYGTGTFRLHYDMLQDAARYDVFAGPVELPCPVVILHGEHDEVVPLANSRRFVAHAAARGCRLQVVPGGDHRLSAHLDLLTAAVDGLWPSLAACRA